MLSKFQHMWNGHLGQTKVAKPQIELMSSSKKTVYSVPHRADSHALEFEKHEINELLVMDVIEATQTEWAPPDVFVPKKDGTLWFCVDYEKFSKVTIRGSYPIHHMDECIDSFADEKMFSTMDPSSTYWHVEVADEDGDKIGFATHQGPFRFTPMAFDLKNALGASQHGSISYCLPLNGS